MSDLTLMAEYIREAMEAVEDAHQAGEDLREDTNRTSLEAFRIKLLNLQDQLGKIKIVLDNEEAFAMDELMDVLSTVYSDHRADYRRTPRIRNHSD